MNYFYKNDAKSYFCRPFDKRVPFGSHVGILQFLLPGGKFFTGDSYNKYKFILHI